MKWLQIPGFSAYEVSENGSVRRAVAGVKCGHISIPAGFVLKPALKSNGYLQYALVDESGKRRYVHAHKLVALAFIGPCPGRGYMVAHNDGSRTSNHKDNLRWATNAENQLDKRIHGTHSCGEKHTSAMLTNDQAREIRHRWSNGEMQSTLAKTFAVSKSVVARIVNNKSYVFNQKVAEYAII